MLFRSLRAAAFLATTFCAVSAYGDVLDLKGKATDMAFMEDGRHMVICHQAENLVSVVRMSDRKVIHEYRVTSPGPILCRGDKVFIANCPHGTVTVLSEKAKFRPVDQLGVGAAEIVALAAPAGECFDGTLLIGCTRQGTAKKSLAVFAVDVAADTCRLLRDDFPALSLSVDTRGRYLTAFDVYDYRLALQRSWAKCNPMFVRNVGSGFHGPGTRVADSVRPMAYRLERIAPPDHVDLKRTAMHAYPGLELHQAGTIVLEDCDAHQPDMVLAATADGKCRLVTVVRGQVSCFEGQALEVQQPALPPMIGRHTEMFSMAEGFGSADGKRIYAIAADILLEIDVEEKRIVGEHALPSFYREWHERDQYFIALGRKFVDLLDKKDFSLIKRIELPAELPDSSFKHWLACDHKRPFSYVCVQVSGNMLSEGSGYLVVIDEEQGTAAEHRDIKAQWAFAPKGTGELLTFALAHRGDEWTGPEEYVSGASRVHVARWRPGVKLGLIEKRDMWINVQRMGVIQSAAMLSWDVTETSSISEQGTRQINRIHLLDTQKLQTGKSFDVPMAGQLRRFLVSPDGRYALGLYHQGTSLVEVKTGKVIANAIDAKAIPPMVHPIAFSADGRWLLVHRTSHNKSESALELVDVKLPN